MPKKTLLLDARQVTAPRSKTAISRVLSQTLGIGDVDSRLRRTHKSISGSCDSQKYFFKLVSPEVASTELRGYEVARRVLPVPKLYFVLRFADASLFLYSFEKSAGPGAMLLRAIANKRIARRAIQAIASHYLNSYATQKKHVRVYPLSLYFKARVSPTLTHTIPKDSRVGPLLDYRFSVNGHLHADSCSTIIHRAIAYFRKPTRETAFVSQGDPTLLNIGLRPVFVDFETAGLNPVVAEFAIFFWGVLIGNTYFDPKYRPASFFANDWFRRYWRPIAPIITYRIDHTNKLVNVGLRMRTTNGQHELLTHYIRLFINRTRIREIETRFKCFLVLRALAVSDFSTYSFRDKILALSLLATICNRPMMNSTIINPSFYLETQPPI